MSEKYTFHVDMSCKFYEKKNVGISFVAAENRHIHKGIFLSKKYIQTLVDKVNADHDFPRLAAICIYYLIKDELDRIESLIICEDEPFDDVRRYLDALFSDHQAYDSIDVKSLGFYRDKIGKKIKSPADGRSNSYRKRGGNRARHHVGVQLNLMSSPLKEVCDVWRKLDVVQWEAVHLENIGE